MITMETLKTRIGCYSDKRQVEWGNINMYNIGQWLTGGTGNQVFDV